MVEEQYIRNVILKYTASQQTFSNFYNTALKLYPLINKWAIPLFRASTIPYSLMIRPIGSYSKGTNIIGVTDIDLFISISSKLPYSLHDIYYFLLNYLKSVNLYPVEQNVSIKIKYNNIYIDLIPARRQAGSSLVHSIYCRKTDSWTKTNVYKHISLIRSSGLQNEIKAIKIWRKLHKLEFPSFYLELSVLDALRGCKKFKVSVNFQRILEYLYNDFRQKLIVDPSNTNNIISDDLSEKEKQPIANTAYSSLSKQSWDQIIW